MYPEIKHNFSPTPPNDDTCHKCYEWREYPGEQAKFGYAWWRICKSWEAMGSCRHQCEHHKTEKWVA